MSAENANCAQLRPQVAPRAVTVMTSLGTYHMFMRKGTYLREVAHLPLPERVKAMRDPAMKEAIINDRSVPSENAGSMQAVVGLYARALNATFSLTFPINYEPLREESVVGRAKVLGVSRVAHVRLVVRKRWNCFLCNFRFKLRQGRPERKS